MSILNPLFEAVAWVMMRIVAVLSVPFGPTSGLTWGLSIVILVVLIRLLMVPLFIKQRNSMQKMQSHMPQLQEIRKKYKNDKQRLNEETMKFYKENGINPLGGCLPLLAQMPVFWALFEVLEAIAQWTPNTPTKFGLSTAMVTNARQAQIFGASLADNFLRPVAHESMGSRIVILIFVLVSAGTTFLTMLQSKRRGMLNQGAPADPDQPGAAIAQSMSKNMMYIAPFFALTGLYWQFGLVIYWVTTNVWTLGQQYFLWRNLPLVGSTNASSSTAQATPGSAGAAAKSAKAAPSGASAKASSASAKGTPSGASAKAAPASASAKASSASAKAAPASASAKAAPASASAKGTSSSASAKAGTKTSESKAAPASKSGTSSSGAAKAPAARSKANGAAANGASSDSSNSPGLLKRFVKKEEPQEVPAAPQAKTVRQQPSRQSRSKRNTGKR